jgi:hypothetical protein
MGHSSDRSALECRLGSSPHVEARPGRGDDQRNTDFQPERTKRAEAEPRTERAGKPQLVARIHGIAFEYDGVDGSHLELYDGGEVDASG